MSVLLLVACRPEAPDGYQEGCSADSGYACGGGLTCVDYQSGRRCDDDNMCAGFCTLACEQSAECPSDETHCRHGWCLRDQEWY